jgi:hypothetical protein
MKYLAGTVQASVTILYPVCRWLSGRNHVAFADIDAALRPSPVVRGEADALLASLRVGRDIGLFKRLGSERANDQATEWTLQESARAQSDDWYQDPVRFRVLVRRMLLAKAVDEITAGETPSDVAVGLAWLLAQDPVRPLPQNYSAGPERALTTQELDSYIATSEQWRALHRWATALGCAEYSQAGGRRLILPDPTAALGEELPSIPNTGMLAKDFYVAVTKELPILDGGWISNFMRKQRAACADPKGDAMVGPSFSLALKRLEFQGTINLLREDDADYRVNGVLHGRPWTFDRVTRGGGNGND